MRSTLLTLLFAVCALAARGQVMREVRVDSAFTSITLASGINLILNSGDKQQVRVEAERSVAQHVICHARGGELSIYATPFKYKVSRRINVYITLDTTITCINASSGNRVRCDDPLRGSLVEVNARNGSDFYIKSDCEHVHVRATNGSLVQVVGEARKATFFADNGSEVRAYDLESGNVSVTATLASKAEVFSNDRLEIWVENDSEVRYKGDPPYLDKHVGKGSRCYAQ